MFLYFHSSDYFTGLIFDFVRCWLFGKYTVFDIRCPFGQYEYCLVFLVESTRLLHNGIFRVVSRRVWALRGSLTHPSWATWAPDPRKTDAPRSDFSSPRETTHRVVFAVFAILNKSCSLHSPFFFFVRYKTYST